jgi:transcription factor IIIB 90 kDa subunit
MAAQTCCDKPSVENVDGQSTCVNCGTVHNESHIVSEITFGESASGAAVVNGGFVGEGQRYARTAGPFRGGGGTEENREFTLMQAKNEMIRQVFVLPVGEVFPMPFANSRVG